MKKEKYNERREKPVKEKEKGTTEIIALLETSSVQSECVSLADLGFELLLFMQ